MKMMFQVLIKPVLFFCAVAMASAVLAAAPGLGGLGLSGIGFGGFSHWLPNASGGINVVGNGGGAAEMLAERANLLLQEAHDDLLGSCFQQPGSCGLSAGDIQALRATLAGATRWGALRFITACTAQTPFAASTSAELQISSCWLYDGGETPSSKPFSVIAALVLTGRVIQVTGMNADTAFALAQRALAALRYEETVFGFDDQSSTIVLWTVSRGAPPQEFVTYHAADSSQLDLTPAIRRALVCPVGSFDLQLDELDASRALARGEVQWNCGSSKGQATIQILVAGGAPRVTLSRRRP